MPRRVWRRPGGRALTLGSAVGIAGVALGLALLPRGAASLDPERVLVTVLENGTGDPRLDRLGDMATDHLVRGLTETGLVRVLDVRNELEPGETLAPVGAPRDLARKLRSGTLLGGRYYRSGDSLFFETQVVDVGTGEARCVVAPAATAAEVAETAPVAEGASAATAGAPAAPRISGEIGNRDDVLKTLDRILRYQRFLRLARGSAGSTAILAAEAGYSDQRISSAKAA